MITPARIPDMMAYIERVPLITVATEVVTAFEKKDSKALAALMVRECVEKGGGVLRQADVGFIPLSQGAKDETQGFYDVLGRIYGSMALSAGISPIDAIAYQTGFRESMQAVSDFPPRLFDTEDFQSLLKLATSILVKYTGSPNPVQKNLEAILTGTGK